MSGYPYDEDDDFTSLPLLNEQGYEILTNGDGEPILDDFGEEIALRFGATPVADVWSEEEVAR